MTADESPLLDYSVAQAAHSLAQNQDYHHLLKRAMKYTKLWRKGFFRPRLSNGKWAPFDEFKWNKDYTEGILSLSCYPQPDRHLLCSHLIRVKVRVRVRVRVRGSFPSVLSD